MGNASSFLVVIWLRSSPERQSLCLFCNSKTFAAQLGKKMESPFSHFITSLANDSQNSREFCMILPCEGKSSKQRYWAAKKIKICSRHHHVLMSTNFQARKSFWNLEKVWSCAIQAEALPHDCSCGQVWYNATDKILWGKPQNREVEWWLFFLHNSHWDFMKEKSVTWKIFKAMNQCSWCRLLKWALDF